MGDVIKFNPKEDTTEEKVDMSPLVEEFFETSGTYTNIELKPAYNIYFENVDGWDGKVTKIERLSKDKSYLSMLGSGTCGLYYLDVSSDKLMDGVVAEFDSDIESVAPGEYAMVLIFNEELEDWVFDAVKANELFLSVC